MILNVPEAEIVANLLAPSFSLQAIEMVGELLQHSGQQRTKSGLQQRYTNRSFLLVEAIGITQRILK